MNTHPTISLSVPVVWYLVVNALAALAIVVDKLRARAGAYRIAEKTLFWMALAGGWPASALMQHLVRHKTRKGRFQLIFWACAFLHCLLAITMYQWVQPTF
jgi:uncharacterized membrane protein YsdA (DUF1294 family)